MFALNSRSSVSLVVASLSLCSNTLVSSARAEAWSEDSNPFVIGPRYEARLGNLPLAADLANGLRPWSGPFWADRLGSIGYRWRTGETLWEFAPPTALEVRSMSREEISRLSPAEKIDVLRGRYDYPTLATVRGYASPDDVRWQGACTGWAQSSLGFEEPRDQTRTNADGIEIPFAVADLKALAAFYYDFVAVSDSPSTEYDDRRVAQIGRRCIVGDSRANCGGDVNPGALHILLANRIGRESMGLIADFSRREPVWQHPIYGFASELVGERAARADAAPVAVREVHVRLDLHYADYRRAEKRTTKNGSRDLEYWLELDGDNRIVGGKYISVRPGKLLDYVWVSEALQFERGYEILNEMIAPRRFGAHPSSTFTFPAEIRPGG